MVILLFDFDQTLVFSKIALIEAERKAMLTFLDYFSDKNPNWTLDFLLDEILKTRLKFYQVYNYSRKDWWTSLLQKLGIYITDEVLELILAQESVHWNFLKNNSKLFPGTIKTISEIKNYYPDIRLGIISDTDGLLGFKNERIGYFKELKTYFDLILVSGEGEYKAKPFSDSFNYARSFLSTNIDEKVYYIGDNIHRDVVGAVKSGCHPIWITHKWVYEEKPILPPKLFSLAFNEEIDLSEVIQIETIQEMLVILEKM